MSAEFNQLFSLLPESNLRHSGDTGPLDTPYHPDYSQPYFQISHEYTITPLDHRPLPSASGEDVTSSPVAPGRLAGEPAFCAGRHCCQWSVGGRACNNHYPSAADLDKHVATEHAGRHANGQPNGDYHCYWAGCSKSESFGNKPKLTRHLHSHTGHKPHPCPFPGCGKGFVTKEQLKNHETTHTKTKEHICPECGKGFAVKTALTSHMNVHRGAKPYICEECGKGFADSSNLPKHKAIHKRMAVKRHHHHHRPSRSSISTNASTPLFSPGLYPNPMAMTGFHDLPSPSIEPPPPPRPLLGRPCFEIECPDQDRLPCRSISPIPCHDQNCDTNTIEHCNVDCHAPDCEPCEASECEPCTMPHCDLPDCLEDCDQFCDLHHYDCFPSSSHDQSGSPPLPPLDTPLPGVSETTTPEHLFIPPDNFGHLNPTSNFPDYTGMDQAGYKQLHDFIHGEGGVDGTLSSTHPHDPSTYP